MDHIIQQQQVKKTSSEIKILVSQVHNFLNNTYAHANAHAHIHLHIYICTFTCTCTYPPVNAHAHATLDTQVKT